MFPILKSLSLAAVALTGWGQTADYSLKFSPKEGAATTYTLTGDMDIQGVNATMESTVVQKILKVDQDGTYSVQSNTVSGKVTYSGQEMQIPKNSSVSIYKSTGEVVSVTGDQIDNTILRSENLVMLKRPEANVKIGEAWTIEQKGDPTTKKPSLHGTFKLVGEEVVGAFHALRVDASVTEGDVALPATTTTSFWLSKDDGSIVKSVCKYSNMPFPGAPSPMSGTLSMMRTDKP